MKTNQGLQARCNKMSGVISLNEVDINQIMFLCHACFSSINNIDEYYFILHDETDTKHIHFLLITRKVVRLSTMLNNISSILNINPFAISIEKVTSINSVLRYFIHSENVEKKQYTINDIASNMSIDIIQDYMMSDDEGISFKRLITICHDSRTEIEVMQVLGLKTFHKYRYEIKCLIENQYETARIYQSMCNNDD